MNISHRTHRLAAIVVGAMFLASCGSSGSNDSAATTTTKAATTTTASSKTTTTTSTSTTLTVAQAWIVDAQEHRAEIGKTFEYDCPAGGEADRIWGVETYTDDSSVCTAAVHVGLITFAKGGKVEIEMVKALQAGKTPTVTDDKSYNNGVKVVPANLLAPVIVTKENAAEAYASDPTLSALTK